MTFFKFLHVLYTFWAALQEAISAFKKEERQIQQDKDWKEDVFDSAPKQKKDKE